MSRKKQILLIDDDRDLLITLSDALHFEGYDVVTAENGEEGLKKLAASMPDLIVLDMNMPGMGGIGFLRQMAAGPQPTPPVFVFTARANMESFFEGMDVVGFLAKPCDPDYLMSEIKRVVGGAGKETPDAAPPAPARTSVRVLLAEDDAPTARDILRVLVNAGYEAERAESGPVALQRAIVWQPDVVLAKVILTEMNGKKLAVTLKSLPNTQRIPVVLYDDTGAANADDYVSPKTGVRAFASSNDPEALLKVIEPFTR